MALLSRSHSWPGFVARQSRLRGVAAAAPGAVPSGGVSGALGRLVSHCLAGGRGIGWRTMPAGTRAGAVERGGAPEPHARPGARRPASGCTQAIRDLPEVLAEELGVEPSAETEALRRQIRDGTGRGDRQQRAASTGGQVGPAGMVPEMCAPSPGLFVARDCELRVWPASWIWHWPGRAAWRSLPAKPAVARPRCWVSSPGGPMEMPPQPGGGRGRCSAYAGVGDPFLPFRGSCSRSRVVWRDLEAGWTGDGGNCRSHASRLRALFPG